MRPLKIIATALVIILLVILSYSIAGDALNSEDSGNSRINPEPEKAYVDPAALQLYQRQQQTLKDAVTAYFDQAIAAGDIVGAGVSITKGDSLLLSEGYGKRKSTSGEMVDGKTIFRLGSLSKGFTGILAARLKTEGKLGWQDKVRDYIPGFQLGDRKNTENITLAHILSHTSGAPYHSYTNLVEAGLPLGEIARRFSNVVPIEKPGRLYSYQNALFALAGEMMHKTTGQDISSLLKSRFFRPLQMGSATMDYETLENTSNVAMPHSKRRNRWYPQSLNHSYYNAVAAGGINANAEDMGKWMRFLLGHNPEILGRSAIEEAINPFIEIKGRSKYYQRWPGHVSSHYGFGWRIHKFVEEDGLRQKTIWHHGGSVNDFRNEIALYPESDLGICVLLNNNSSLARTVIPDLYAIVQQVYSQAPGVDIAETDFRDTDSDL